MPPVLVGGETYNVVGFFVTWVKLRHLSPDKGSNTPLAGPDLELVTLARIAFISFFTKFDTVEVEWLDFMTIAKS
jgi:hypothetical protein